MAFFRVIRKYVSESGAPHLLAESGIIENGSLTSFLLGKRYKRSKRIHRLLALRMETQHLNSFKLSLQDYDLKKFGSLEDDLANVTDGDKKKFMAEHTNELIKKYEEFTQETRNGNHAKYGTILNGIRQHVASLPRICKKHQNRRSGFLHILLTANNSNIFHVQSSKLLTLAHRVSRQVT